MSTTWFITGISSGLGRELAVQALSRGDKVVGTVRKLSAAGDLERSYPETLLVKQLDVTDTPAVRKVVGEAFAECGTIDVIVNNAGYGLLGAAEELTDEQIVHQIDTNLVGSIQVIRAALPGLRAQGSGKIIQISTMGGQATFPGGVLYHTSKWGVEGFADAIRHELAPFNISVVIVEPGSARTDFGNAMQYAPALEAYGAGPVGMARQYFSKNRPPQPGDPVKMVSAIIKAADLDKPPLRLALGSDAYNAMHRALSERLNELESQEQLARSTDFG